MQATTWAATSGVVSIIFTDNVANGAANVKCQQMSVEVRACTCPLPNK
jgi:hypothetical protein